MKSGIIKFLLICLVLVFSTKAKASKLDSLLNRLALIEDQNSTEILDEKSILCNDIAVYYQGTGENQKARTYFLQSIHFTETRINLENNWDAQNTYDIGYLYKNVAIFESTVGNPEESEEYMQKAEKHYKALGQLIPKEEHNAIMVDFYQTNFSRFYHRENYEEAERYILKAEELLTAAKESEEMLAETYRLHGEMFNAQQAYSDAEVFFMKALGIIDEIEHKNAGKEMRFIHSILTAKYHSGKNQELIDFIKSRDGYRSQNEAKSRMNEIEIGYASSYLSNIFILSFAHLNIYRESHEMEHLRAAYSWQKLGFELAESQTIANQSEKIQSTLGNSRNKVMGYLMATLDMQEVNELDSSGVFNAMRIVDVYHATRLHLERISYDINATNWEEQKAIKNELNFVNRKLDEWIKDDATIEKRDSLRARAYQLSLALLQAGNKTKKEAILAEYQLGQDGFEQKIKHYLSETKKNILTCFYDDGADSVYILLANSDTNFIKALDVPTTFQAEIGELYNLNAHLQYSAESIDRQNELNHTFFKRLFEPIIPFLSSDQVLVYPLNELSYVSFDALRDNEGSYLVNHYTFQYTSSLYSIINSEPRTSSNSLASFYPLDYGTDELAFLFNGKQEIDQIQKLFKGEKYEGNRATKANFLSAAKSHQILHLASHSVLNMDRPYESYMIFDASEDSINNHLFAYEIFASTFNAELVILSSCNSAQGTTEEGMGTVSLANAFYFAGVPATISSLWSAQDKSSSALMKVFYESMSQGKHKSESLRDAKLSYLAKADKIKRQPFFWANYVLYGSDEPLIQKGTKSSWWNYIIGAVLCLLLIFVGIRYFNSLNKR